MNRPGRIVYGPGWPDPGDPVAYLEQMLQIARTAIADGRTFQPVKVWVILLDDRNGDYHLSDTGFNMTNADAIAAMRVSSRRCERALDPDCEFDPEG